jgi:FkbM family methyltransferase
MSHLFYKAVGLYFWSKVFTEGYGVKAKIRLMPNTIFRVIFYATGAFNDLVIRFAPDVMINNKNGIFKCRKGSCDIQIVAEGFERNLTRHLMKIRSGIFVDIGANVGRYTISVARQMGDRGKVIAIEADPKNYETLLENIKLNKLDNVYAVDVACWDKEEDIKFASGSIGSIVKKENPSTKTQIQDNMITVHGNTLDNILKGLSVAVVDIVKIDVEGAEKEVLLGMQDIMAKSNNIEILFEAWDENRLEECRKVLEDNGLVVEDKEIDKKMYRARKMA